MKRTRIISFLLVGIILSGCWSSPRAFQTIDVSHTIHGDDQDYTVDDVEIFILESDEHPTSAYFPRIWKVENHRDEAIWINTNYKIYEWNTRFLVFNRWEEENVPSKFLDANDDWVDNIQQVEPGESKEFSIYINETDLKDYVHWNNPKYATYHIVFDMGTMDESGNPIQENEVKIQFTLTSDSSAD